MKYGFDINNEFSNFDPATSVNDCGYTVLSNIYQSVTAPGQYAISSGVAKSWTDLQQRGNKSRCTSGPTWSSPTEIAGHGHRRHGQPAQLPRRRARCRSSLFAIASISYPPRPQLPRSSSSTSRTAGDFLWAMTYIDGSVYPASTFATAATTPIGAGPFMLKSYQPGSSIELVKNPKYWDSAAYPLGAVDFVEVTNGPQAVSAITSGAVDMISLDPQQYTEVKHDPNIGVAITQSYDYLVLQTRNNRAPFNNVKVRAALEYAIDRNEINKVVFSGVGRPAFQPFPPNSPGYNKSVGNKYVYDPTAPRPCWPPPAFHAWGCRSSSWCPSGDTTLQRLATIMQSEMDAAGFKASIQLIPGLQTFSQDVYIKKEGNALLLSEDLTNGPDISNTFESEYEPTGFPAQYLGTEDLAITPDIEAANASLSASLQGPLMQKVGATVMAQGLRDAD